MTAFVTVSDAVIVLLAATKTGSFNHFTIQNTSANAGFFSIDGGVTFFYLAASSSRALDGVHIWDVAIQFKRVAGQGDVTGYWDAWKGSTNKG